MSLAKIRLQEGRGRSLAPGDWGWEQGGAEAQGGRLASLQALPRQEGAGFQKRCGTQRSQRFRKGFLFFFLGINTSIKEDTKTDFPLPFFPTVGQSLPSPYFPVTPPAKSRRAQGSTQKLRSSLSFEISCSGLSNTTPTHLSPGEPAVTLSSSHGPQISFASNWSSSCKSACNSVYLLTHSFIHESLLSTCFVQVSIKCWGFSTDRGALPSRGA